MRAEVNISYNLPVADSATVQRISELVDQVARARNKALNDWLERQVESWCPEAAGWARDGLYGLARCALHRGRFHWRSRTVGGDEFIEFCRGEVGSEDVEVLSGIRIELWHGAKALALRK